MLWSGLYSPCYILFLTCNSPKSQSPQGVPTESLRDCKGTPGGVPQDFLGTPWKLLGDSLGTPWGLERTSAKLELIPKESLGTPQRLLRDCSGTPWGLPSYVWLSVTTSPSWSWTQAHHHPIKKWCGNLSTYPGHAHHTLCTNSHNGWTHHAPRALPPRFKSMRSHDHIETLCMYHRTHRTLHMHPCNCTWPTRP